MKRRDFLAANGAALLGALGTTRNLFSEERHSPARPPVTWHRDGTGRLFDRVAWNGRPLVTKSRLAFSTDSVGR